VAQPLTDEQIAALARRQHGAVSRAQLLELGLGADAITYRCQTGRLYRAHLGVFTVGRPPTTPLERASAAVLACGPGAALSHRSAFTLWGLDRHWQFPLHVSSASLRRPAGIVTHKFPSQARRDITIQLGIRVTSPARTFLDCAPALTRERLRRALGDARRAGHLKPAAIDDVLERFPTHPGHAPLLSAVKGYQPTRSEFEHRFVRFCAAHNLPPPTINRKANGHEADITFEGHQVIVELDGYDFHRDRYSFESDRDRDADLLAHGIPTMRITWERMTETPVREADRLRRILGRFGPS
jgi:very-short-patch-repair endonuclease